MLSTRFLTLFVALFATSLAWADARVTSKMSPLNPPATFGFGQIEDLVRKRNITSVEGLLEELPPVFLRHYSLLFSSRSPNPASYLDPRVILFAPGQNTFIGFNSKTGGTRADLVEVIDFDPKLNRYRFNGIDFTNNQAQKLPVTETTKCLACHSSSHSLADAHPIWDTYPMWPGCYGSIVHPTIHERKIIRHVDRNYQFFVASSLNDPRYRRLEHDHNSLAEMNMNLGNEIARGIPARAVNSLTGSPHIATYRAAFASLNVGNESYFVTQANLNAEDAREFYGSIERIENTIAERSDRYYRSKYFRFARRSGFGTEDWPDLTLINLDRPLFDQYARLEFLLHKLNLSPALMEMSLKRRSYAWVQGHVSVSLLSAAIEESCRRALDHHDGRRP